MNEILIISTADTMDLAQKISYALVRECKAACVNIVPGIRSIYRWEGKICDEAEYLLVIKSTHGNFESIRGRILDLHSYQTPEVISIPIAAGDPDYLNWLQAQVGQTSMTEE
jgi:periplasmic divalent cation tolerance protein